MGEVNEKKGVCEGDDDIAPAASGPLEHSL